MNNSNINQNLNNTDSFYEKDAQLFNKTIPEFKRFLKYLQSLPNTTPYSYGISRRNLIDEYSERIIHFGYDEKRLEQVIAELTYMHINPLELFLIVYLSKNPISQESVGRIVDYIIKTEDKFSIYMFAKYINYARDELVKKGIDNEYIELPLEVEEDEEFIELHQQLINVDFALVHSISKNMIRQYREVGKCDKCLLKLQAYYNILHSNFKLHDKDPSIPVLTKKKTPPKPKRHN